MFLRLFDTDQRILSDNLYAKCIPTFSTFRSQPFYISEFTYYECVSNNVVSPYRPIIFKMIVHYPVFTAKR